MRTELINCLSPPPFKMFGSATVSDELQRPNGHLTAPSDSRHAWRLVRLQIRNRQSDRRSHTGERVYSDSILSGRANERTPRFEARYAEWESNRHYSAARTSRCLALPGELELWLTAAETDRHVTVTQIRVKMGRFGNTTAKKTNHYLKNQKSKICLILQQLTVRLCI